MASEFDASESRKRQRALEIRLQMLTVAVLVASVLVPFLIYLASR